MVLNAEDDELYDITLCARFCSDFIAYHQVAGGCLVHCWAGVNRSAAVVVCFMSLHAKVVALEDAFKQATRMRGAILCNQAFRRKIAEAWVTQSILFDR